MHLIYNEQTGDFEEKLYINPPEVSFNAANRVNSVFKGDIVHLVWSVKDAEKVILDGEEITDQFFSKDVQCDDVGIRDFVLVASNFCGETKRVLSISVINKPSFDISCSKNKLRRGKNETCELRWNIRFANSAFLTTSEGTTTIESSGTRILSPSESEEIKFEAKAIDNSTSFTETYTIGVFDESIVQFETDKEYSFPQLPIVLSWKVDNAQSIELIGFGEQPAEGFLVVEPLRTTTYKLMVKDEFGEKTYEKTIQMLPLPFVKSILLPTPHLESNLSLTIKQPKFNVDVKFPMIDIDWIKAEVPKVPSFKELGLNVELSPPLPRTNLMSSIKRVFNHIIRK